MVNTISNHEFLHKWSAGRTLRHMQLPTNDIFYRALLQAGLPSTKRSCRVTSHMWYKRPDGLVNAPWQDSKLQVSCEDFRVADTLADF